MPRTKRIITAENITELTKTDMEKIQAICLKLANRYKPYGKRVVPTNDNRDFELFLDTRYDKKIFAKCMYWSVPSGIGINVAFECYKILGNGEPVNTLEAANWHYRDYENANYPQINTIIGNLTSPYNFSDIFPLRVGETSSELIERGSRTARKGR